MTSMFSVVRRSAGRVKRSRPVRGLVNAMLWRDYRVAEQCNLFWGVFPTFAEAAAAAPNTKPIGYDNPEPAEMYRSLLDKVGPNEYAVLHWLQKCISDGSRVFDFGGHVGVKYYAFRAIDALPNQIHWTVFDVPAVVKAGAELASERGEKHLSFTERFEDASGADVFLALGSLQYVEVPLPEKLAKLEALPPVVVVSSAPLVDGPRYVTLQNIGTAFCPYLIEDRNSLVSGMSTLGYKLAHEWNNPGKSCSIIDQPEKSVEEYSSMHFTLR